MGAKSHVFNPGEKLEGTMLTIIGPAKKGTWSVIKCRCECGNIINLPYQRVYYHTFSCGCTRRLKLSAIDYAGIEVYNSVGNNRTGRKLTVLWWDPDTQQWVYACSCCGEAETIPRGLERGLRSSLKEIAGQICPHYRKEYLIDKDYVSINAVMRDFREEHHCKAPEPLKRTERARYAGMWDPFMIAQYWLDTGRYERRHVRFRADGTISHLYGLPQFRPEDRIEKRREGPPYPIWKITCDLCRKHNLPQPDKSWDEMTEEEIAAMETWMYEWAHKPVAAAPPPQPQPSDPDPALDLIVPEDDDTARKFGYDTDTISKALDSPL